MAWQGSSQAAGFAAHKEVDTAPGLLQLGRKEGSECQAAGGLTSRWLVAKPHRRLTWVGGGQLLCKLSHARGFNCIHLSCPGLQAATVQAGRPGHPSSSTWACGTKQHSTWLPAELWRGPPGTGASCSCHRPQPRPDRSCCSHQHPDAQHSTYVSSLSAMLRLTLAQGPANG